MRFKIAVCSGRPCLLNWDPDVVWFPHTLSVMAAVYDIVHDTFHVIDEYHTPWHFLNDTLETNERR